MNNVLDTIIVAAIAFGLLCAGVYVGYEHIKEQGAKELRDEVQKVADKLNKEYREKERLAQAESDRKYSEYENQIKTTMAAHRQLDASAGRLRESIAGYKNRLSQATFDPLGVRVTEERETGADLLGECAERYRSMAKEAGRLADKANALIDQSNVRVVMDSAVQSQNQRADS